LLNPLAAFGEVLTLGTLIMGLAGFLQFYARTRYRVHLAMLPAVVVVLGSAFLLFSSYAQGNTNGAALFLVLQSIALPFYMYWGEQNRKSMERIAATGDFDPGFPLPSENLITISFFGQIYEDLAKPIVVLEGPRRLNDLLEKVAEGYPILTHARFTNNGDFRLDQRTITALGRTKLDYRAFAELLQEIIQHFKKTANIKGRGSLARAITAKCGSTISKYMDFLIEEDLLHSLAGGLFTDKISTGAKDLDKALEGGFPQGIVILLVGNATQEREDFVQSFVRAGVKYGESSIVVTATRSPERIRSEIGAAGLPGELRIVDCYTSRFSEVPSLETHGDTIISPVSLSVVSIAISRALESLTPRKKRAVVDFLSAYLMASPVEKIYSDLLDIVARFRRSQCTALFVFNPFSVEDETAGSVLEELFDCVIRIEDQGLSFDFKKIGFHLSSPLPSEKGELQLGERHVTLRERAAASEEA